jgi:nucleoid DNA-binding protein
MVINLRQNKNSSSNGYGKWYPEADSKEPLALKGFCRHMTEHGKLADYQMVVLVVQQVVECMKELICQGQPVKLEGLGTFSPSVEAKKGGANTVAKAMEVGLDSLIEGVHIVFTPENAKGEKLTSRSLKDDCVFTAGYVVESIKTIVEGKEKRFQNKTPISFVLSPANGGGAPSGGGSSTGSDTGNGGSEQGGNSGSQSGNEGGNNQATTYALTITKSGTGTASVKNDSEETINSGDNLASGANVYIAVTPATGQIPTATLNGESVSLSENDGEYVGTFQMPAQASSLVINSGSVSGGSADQN